MTIAVIVQARFGSSRLPGKVLNPLGNGTVLQEVLRRCQAIPGIDAVVCAVPDAYKDDKVAEEAVQCGAIVVRGHETDVLDRYVKSARTINADIVMRVTSDCPLIDPEVCGEVLRLLVSERVDYACNNFPPSFPHGMDCEAFTRQALELAWVSGKLPEDREHVTPWIRRALEMRRANYSEANSENAGILSKMRWTLDYPEDYEFFRSVFSLLPSEPSIPSWRLVCQILSDHPEIQAINAGRCQR